MRREQVVTGATPERMGRPWVGFRADRGVEREDPSTPVGDFERDHDPSGTVWIRATRFLMPFRLCQPRFDSVVR
jgi:hypothetical protein